MTKYYRTPHLVYDCKYHVIFCPKYRRNILVNGLDELVKSVFLKIAEQKDFQIIEMEVMPDHIHLLVDCKPQHRLSDAIKILKGNTARWLFLEHPEIKSSLWGGHLWNPSYFVATVSDRSYDQVRTYIETQKTGIGYDT